MSFDRFGLCEKILKAVKEQGYVEPTSIQEQAIPLILEKRDVLGGAQTGTGKTASFLLPLLHLIRDKINDKKNRSPRVLILSPTRELAMQIHESVHAYGKYLQVRSSVVFGGTGIKPQIIKLRKGVDIVVATPGRLLDHVNRNTADLSSIDILVLDEADCMLDMGFIHDIRKIIECLPKQRQNLLFSATFSPSVRKLAEDLLKDPSRIDIAPENKVSGQVKQVVCRVDKEKKQKLLLHLIRENKWEQLLVFTRTKHMADRLHDFLKEEKISTAVIHGDKRQSARAKALASFKKGNAKILVATDVAARGIDIDQLPLVVNYELPFVPSDYIHRIGRTGRAGHKGEAYSFVCVDENGLLRDIEKLVKQDFEKLEIPGFEVNKSIKPQPLRKGGMRKGGGNKPSFNNRGAKQVPFKKGRGKFFSKRKSSEGKSLEGKSEGKFGDSGKKKPFNREKKPFAKGKKPFNREKKSFDKEKITFEGKKSFVSEKKSFNKGKKPFTKGKQGKRPFRKK